MSGKLIDLAAYRAARRTKDRGTATGILQTPYHCERCGVPDLVTEDIYGYWCCDTCSAESDRRWVRGEDAADGDR